MTATFTAAVPELGREAGDAIGDVLKRALDGAPVAQYVEGTPIAWDVIRDGGWDMLGATEDDGGADLDLRDLIEIGKVVGRWLPPIPLTSSIMAKRWSVAARSEPGAVSIAVRTPSGRILAPFGATEGVLLIGPDGDLTSAARTPDDYAPSLRLAEGGEPSGLGADAAREIAIVWAAEAVGCAERLLDIGVAYVSQRQQFGQPVGRFQAVKHHLANALIECQQAESAVLWAGAEPDRATAALEVAFTSALRTAELVVQVHGGIGFTWELGLHMYMRHIVALRQLSLALAAQAEA